MTEFHKTPAYRLEVNGKPFTADSGRLISLRLTDYRGEKADQLDIELSDADQRLELPPTGAEIAVWLGWQSEELVYKGRFTVDEVNYSDQSGLDTLSIKARAADFRGPLKVKREQSWRDLSLGEIVTEIARRNDLTAVIHQDLGSKVINHIDQTNESDISFVNRLAGRFDALATIKDKNLLFTAKGEGNTASGKSLPVVTITRRKKTSFSYRESDRDSRYTGVKALWNNQKYAKREEEIAGEQGELFTIRHTYPNAEEAQQAAQAKWREIQRGSVGMTLELSQGRPDLFPEIPVTLRGFKEKISDQTWLIAELVHQLAGGGLTTSVQLEIYGYDTNST